VDEAIWGVTAPPAPAMARPMIRATDVGATAQIKLPTTINSHVLRDNTLEDGDRNEEHPLYIEYFI
jgi:hypothetical protein